MFGGHAAGVDDGAGLFYVFGNLCGKGFDVFEVPLVAQFCEEKGFDIFPVDGAVKIDEMEFDDGGNAGIVAIKCGAGAVAECPGMELVADACLDGIDTLGGKDFIMGVEVGAGESEGTSDGPTGNDGAEDAGGTSEHCCGRFQFSALYGIANACTGNRGIAIHDGGHGVYGYPCIAAKFCE